MPDLFDQFVQFGTELEHKIDSIFNSVYNRSFGGPFQVKNSSGTVTKHEPVMIIHHHHHYCGPSACIRLAGLSGGLAVVFSAYGAHFVNDNPDLSAERKRSMQYANQHHFLNTIGMVLASMASRRPTLTAALFFISTLLFCGPSYAYAITANRMFKNLTPIGGVMAMLAWFSFIF